MTRDRPPQTFWTPPTVWAGETAFVVASGPSLRRVDLEQLRGRHTIVVNSSVYRMPWAEVLFFTDTGWFQARRKFVENFPGLVVSLSRTAKSECPDKVYRILGRVENSKFIAPGSDCVRQGRSSGQTAISLAIAFGAATVVLLGFDMKIDHASGRSHEHDDYRQKTHPTVFSNEFLPAFRGWNQQALDIGVSILNATADSAIEEFPRVDLVEFLRSRQDDRTSRVLDAAPTLAW